ncbi:MAG: metallophosphoesterase, partial [Thermoguttaceae bacterium]|nr:metallophosphoesterase [Thermoguttaceae bacterium]
FIETGLNNIRELKKACPDILVCNMSRHDNSADYVSETIAEHCDFIQLRNNNYTPEDIKRLKAAGVRVNMYGANAVELLQTMFDQGVDFVLVDMTEAMQKAAIPKGITPIVRDEKIEADPNLTVLISDVHVGVDAMKTGYAADNEMKLKVILERVVSMKPRPARVVIMGDLAYDHGTTADYQKIKPVLSMLDQAGIPWTSAMGNHDRRVPFAEIFPEKASQSMFPGRNVFIVPTPSFDFILLDSLNEGTVASTTDTAQMQWLDGKLAEYAKSGRKAFVCAHHPMSETGAQDILAKYPQVVSGYIFGHHHHWQHEKIACLETVGMPSTGYSKKYPPLGYATLRVTGNNCRFTLLTSDMSDKKNGDTIDIPLASSGTK